MLRLARTDVPIYLRGGSFFAGLNVEDDGVFEVPEDCFKFDTSVATEQDLKSLLRCVRFWGLRDVPSQALLYIISDDDHGQRDLMDQLNEFEPFMEKALKVKAAEKSCTIATTIKEGFGVEVVSLLIEKGHECTADCCEAAASVGDLESLTYLHSEGCPWNERTASMAAFHGHLSCLQYALDSGCPTAPHLMKVAAGGGHIEVLKLLRDVGLAWDTDTLTAAVMWGHLECVRFLHEEGCDLNVGLCFVAAHHDRFECLQYLHEDCGLSLTGVGFFAAGSGKLRCLQYAHENGDVWDQSCCEVAARGDHVDCLRYAREHGCPWDESTLIAATANGSWACMRYTLCHGCPCFRTAFTAGMTLVLLATFVLMFFTPVKSYLLRVSQVVTYLTPLVLHLFRMYNHELHYIPQSTRDGAVVVFILVALPMLVYNLAHGISAVRHG